MAGDKVNLAGAIVARPTSCRCSLLLRWLWGVGKTWFACALAHKACRDGHGVRCLRLPRLMEEAGLAHGDGRFAKLM